jgi:carboxylesterase
MIDNTIKEEVISGCEAYHHEKGDSACLLIHGLCGSPYEMAKLSDYLNKFNYTTRAPRYPGHGCQGKIMDKFGWQDWYAEVEKNYLELKKKYSKVYIIGFSTGGTLALKLATRYSVDKIIVVSTFISVTKKWYYLFKPETYLKTVGKLFNYLPTLIPPYNLNDPVERKAYIKVKYISLNAMRNTLELIENVKENLYQVTAPILVIHALKDITTSPSSSEYIYNNVSSKIKELLWLEKSNHIVLLDYEKEMVFEKIKAFIEK